MLILGANDLNKIINHNELVNQIITGLKSLENDEVDMPQRTHLDFGENTLLLMPCIGSEHFATKLVSMFPGNSQKGLPPIYGSVILNDGQTGKPLAMIEGAILTGLRTGAVGGIGVRYTARQSIENMGLVGTGTQGFYQLQFILRERPVELVYLYNDDPKPYTDFISRMAEDFPQTQFLATGTVKELVQKSDLIITATNSNTPVLPEVEGLYKNKQIVAIGSYKPEMQEIPDEAFKSAGQIVVDTDHAFHESGDVINPVKKELIKKDQVICISKVVTGKKTISKSGTTIFKAVGMALFDLAAAKYFYEKATQIGVGTYVDF